MQWIKVYITDTQQYPVDGILLVSPYGIVQNPTNYLTFEEAKRRDEASRQDIYGIQHNSFTTLREHLRVGDVIWYIKTDSNFEHKLDVRTVNVIVVQDFKIKRVNHLPTIQHTYDGDLRVMSFNIENMFGPQITKHMSTFDYDSNRGVKTWDTVLVQMKKLLSTIVPGRANILCINEFGNDKSTVRGKQFLNFWSQMINQMSPITYRYLNIEQDTIIYNQIFYDTSKLKPIGKPIIVTKGPFENTRKPVCQKFYDYASKKTFVVVCVHFKSKGGYNTPDLDEVKYLGHNNNIRLDMSQTLIDFIDSEFSNENVIITGDMNANLFEEPVHIFERKGFVNLSYHIKQGPNYTVVWEGASGIFDHMIVNKGFFDNFVNYQIVDTNASESFAYSVHKSEEVPTDLLDTTPARSSDHNPVIADFKLC